ncbi:type II toxin-antitoxin system VapC family toxin [Microbacterium sp. BWT-B31]|uniref:type II toxin-antitoxin system VapC family toxin n=1 Tax=Microbacterium sp. BWT-B31 TaxID=3232072 RepID=UPI00352969BF
MRTGRIAVDTSALVAVLFAEPDAGVYADALARHAGDCSLSASTLVESRIVVESRLGPDGNHLLTVMLERLSMAIVPLDSELAERAAAAWRRFGKGRHPARLNMGDCFSYALAQHFDVPLLFKGDDFGQTDIASVL